MMMMMMTMMMKEKRILELEDEVKRSEDRLKKVSRFLEEQTTRVNILEENYNNTQKVVASLNFFTYFVNVCPFPFV